MSSVGFIRGPLWQHLIKHSRTRVWKRAEECQRERLREARTWRDWESPKVKAREGMSTPHSHNNILTETLTSPSGSFEAWIITGAIANALSHTVPSVSPLWHLSWRTVVQEIHVLWLLSDIQNINYTHCACIKHYCIKKHYKNIQLCSIYIYDAFWTCARIVSGSRSPPFLP